MTEICALRRLMQALTNRERCQEFFIGHSEEVQASN